MGAQAPFVLSASRTTADGAVETLVSVVPTATASTTVNISPVTNLIASRLSSSGDPSKLASELSAGTSTISTSTVATKVAEVQALLAPVLTAAGVTGTDPLSVIFATDGTGYDRMLDAIKVTVTPSSATSANIEISIKQQLPDGTTPTAITFTSQTAAANLPALPSIAANTLPPSGTSAQIAAHLAQLTACYALPITTRINSTVTGGLATGTAANVVATSCRSAFFGDDPSTFLGNGAHVGRDTNNNGAFAGLFRNGATGVVFSQGGYEFSRNNGDIVASYKSRDSLGNEAFDTFVLRQDTDGKLKQIGNQYTYAGGVVAYLQLREFVTQSSSNYYSSGYDLRVPLITGVSYVDVVSPRGNHITLIPGADSMVLPRRNVTPLTASGTTYIRLRSEYVASTGTPTAHPSVSEASLFFVPTDFTEDEIIGIPNQSVWAFNYYSGGSNASGGTLLATQLYKTRTRANTIAELRNQVWANLSSTSIADMVGRFQANGGGLGAGFATLPAAMDLATSWVVPTGALPPTQVKLFGNALYFDYANSTTKAGGAPFTSTTNSVGYANGRTNFSDGLTIGSTARSASAIGCFNGAIDINDMGERHCANPGPGYLASARQTGLHLWARDPSGREYAHFYAPYTLQ
jgi:hypothetical protein